MRDVAERWLKEVCALALWHLDFLRDIKELVGEQPSSKIVLERLLNLKGYLK